MTLECHWQCCRFKLTLTVLQQVQVQAHPHSAPASTGSSSPSQCSSKYNKSYSAFKYTLHRGPYLRALFIFNSSILQLRNSNRFCQHSKGYNAYRGDLRGTNATIQVNGNSGQSLLLLTLALILGQSAYCFLLSHCRHVALHAHDAALR